jgi:hypothetical protein
VERRGHGLFHRRHDEDEPGAWCPTCGGEFRAGTTWCDDCGVPLSSERPVEGVEEVEAPDDAVVSDRHDVVEYDLAAWSDEQVAELEEQLAVGRVPHEWEDRHLRVPGAQEAAVDELVDAIEDLDEVADDVQYEFEEWTPEQCQQLVDRLLELGVACRWDGYLLGVADADEATVDAEVLKIDPTFPVTVTDAEGEAPPDLGIPEGPGWGATVGEAALGFLGLQRDP